MTAFTHGYALLIGVGDAKDPTLSMPATVVVYYSGHGWLEPFDYDYFLLSYETDSRAIPDTALSAVIFSQALQAIPARRLFVAIDSCHAQGMATAKDVPKDQGNLIHSGVPKGVINALKQGEGRAVFTSSRGTQKSWLRRAGKLSIYTTHLLEALQGAANQAGDTVVKLSNLMNHLSKTVPQSAQPNEQTPFFDTAAEDFPIALLCGGKGLPDGDWKREQPDAATRPEKQEHNETVTQIAGEHSIQINKARDVSIRQ